MGNSLFSKVAALVGGPAEKWVRNVKKEERQDDKRQTDNSENVMV